MLPPRVKKNPAYVCEPRMRMVHTTGELNSREHGPFSTRLSVCLVHHTTEGMSCRLPSASHNRRHVLHTLVGTLSFEFLICLAGFLLSWLISHLPPTSQYKPYLKRLQEGENDSKIMVFAHQQCLCACVNVISIFRGKGCNYICFCD